MSEERFEYVPESKSHKHSGFVRKRPYTNDNPTAAQQRTRYLFAKAARGVKNNEGTVMLEDIGKEVPKNAKAVREQMKGVKLAKPKVPRFVPPELAKIMQLREAMSKLARGH